MSELHPLLNINSYIQDGFEIVADVRARNGDGKWEFVDQKPSLFEAHKSWVYAVVLGEEIVKIGETGLQLGIRPQVSKYNKSTGELKEDQPLIGTTNRMGRLRGFGHTFSPQFAKDTDVRIRSALHEDASEAIGNVSVWAKRCDMIGIESTLYGEPYVTYTTYHKQLEGAYLTRIRKETGVLPRLNPVKI